MSTAILKQLKLEDAIKDEYKKRFPALDADGVVKRILDVNCESTRKTTKVLMAMWPEVLRVNIKEGKG